VTNATTARRRPSDRERPSHPDCDHHAACGLPPGLSVDTGIGVIDGSPTTPGTSTATITDTNGDDGAPAITLESLGLTGGLDEAATVTVNDVADQDEAVDASDEGAVDLGDDGLPDDPPDGSSATGTLSMEATDGTGKVGGHEVSFELHH